MQNNSKFYDNGYFLTDNILDDRLWWNSVQSDYKSFLGEDYEEKIRKNGIASDNADKVRKFFKEDEKGDTIFPNYIGGLYINKDNNLVIQIVKDNIPNILSSDYDIYNKIIKIDSIIEYVDYSNSELVDINNEIVNHMHDESLINEIGITKVYIDTINNRIVVNLIDDNEFYISLFKNNVYDSNIIVFKRGNFVQKTLKADPQ